MCSGTMGIHMRRILALGLVRMNLTVVSSTATAFFMLTVYVEKAERSFWMM